MKKIYKYVLFDWDGCLAKTLNTWFDSMKIQLQKNNIILSDSEIANGFGDWEFGLKVGIKDNEKFIKEIVEEVNIKLKNVLLYPNAINLIEELKKRNKKIALVTTSIKPSVMPALDKFRLREKFDVILTAEDVTKHKPDPEVVLKALNLLNAEVNETLIIGDGPKDIIAGKSAGITTVSFYPVDNKLYYSEEQIKSYGADYVISDLLDLLKIVG